MWIYNKSISNSRKSAKQNGLSTKDSKLYLVGTRFRISARTPTIVNRLVVYLSPFRYTPGR